MEIMTTYGKVKVKRTSPRMDEVPEDCGYMKQFEFNVDMNSKRCHGRVHRVVPDSIAKANGVGGSNRRRD